MNKPHTVENTNRKGYWLVSWSFPGCLFEVEDPTISNDPETLWNALEMIAEGMVGMMEGSPECEANWVALEADWEDWIEHGMPRGDSFVFRPEGGQGGAYLIVCREGN